MPRLLGGGIKRWYCLTSVAYIGPIKSRTEGLGRLKLTPSYSSYSPRHTWLRHPFQGQMLRSQGACVGILWRPPAQLILARLRAILIHGRISRGTADGGQVPLKIEWMPPCRCPQFLLVMCICTWYCDGGYKAINGRTQSGRGYSSALELGSPKLCRGSTVMYTYLLCCTIISTSFIVTL